MTLCRHRTGNRAFGCCLDAITAAHRRAAVPLPGDAGPPLSRDGPSNNGQDVEGHRDTHYDRARTYAPCSGRDAMGFGWADREQGERRERATARVSVAHRPGLATETDSSTVRWRLGPAGALLGQGASHPDCAPHRGLLRELRSAREEDHGLSRNGRVHHRRCGAPAPRAAKADGG